MAESFDTPRAAVIQDLSGVGRCALSVALPIISAMGIQACPMPTAVLSAHTGGFTKPVSVSLTGYISNALAHWEREDVRFQGIYSGYLADTAQVDIVRAFILRQRDRCETRVVVDPAMADHGRLYSNLTEDVSRHMRSLCAEADVITPNLTEAFLLAGMPYREEMLSNAETIRLLNGVLDTGCGAAIITGVPLCGRNCQANICVTAGNAGGFWYCAYPHLDIALPGTGDIFASVLTGVLLRGEALPEAMARATDFTFRAVQRTVQAGTPAREGALFEALLPTLLEPEARIAPRYLFS